MAFQARHPYNMGVWTSLAAVLLLVLSNAVVVAQEDHTMFYATGVNITRREWRNFMVTVMSVNLNSSQYEPVALAFDPAEQRVYWSDFKAKMIYSFNRSMNDGRKLYQLNTVATAYALVIDSRSRLLFYADDANRVIAMLTLNRGYYRTVLGNSLTSPRGLDIDPTNGIVYYSDIGSSPKIASVRYDGTDHTTLVSTDLNNPHTLAFDAAGGKVYWADYVMQRVESLDVRGTAGRKVVVQSASVTFTYMEVFQDFLFFSTFNRTDIRWMRKNETATRLYHVDQFGGVLGLCVTNNNETKSSLVPEGCNCSHICMPAPTGQWKCLCPDGLLLQSDGITCSVDSNLDRFLVLSDAGRHQLFRMDLDSGVHVPMHVPAFQPFAVDVDVLQQRVYWSDVSERTLRSAALDGGDVRLVRQLDGSSAPRGLKVDAKAGLLFYTDTGLDIVAGMRLNGSDYKVLASSNLAEPKALVLDTETRYIYFVDHGQPPKIERLTYEGTDRVTLVSSNLGWPTGITLDMPGQQLYWCDYKLKTIETMKVDGTERRTILTRANSNFMALAFYNNFLYIVDASSTGLQRVKTDGTTFVTFGASDFKSLSDVVVYDSGIYTTTAPPTTTTPTTTMTTTPTTTTITATTTTTTSTTTPAGPLTTTTSAVGNGAAANTGTDTGVIIGSVSAASTLVVVIILALVIVFLLRRKSRERMTRSPSVNYDPNSDYARLSESGSGGSTSQLGMGLWSVQGQNGAFQRERQVNNIYLSAGKLQLEPVADYEAPGAAPMVEDPAERHIYETLPCDRGPNPRPCLDSGTYIRPVHNP